jgi:hypothetical protein
MAGCRASQFEDAHHSEDVSVSYQLSSFRKARSAALLLEVGAEGSTGPTGFRRNMLVWEPRIAQMMAAAEPGSGVILVLEQRYEKESQWCCNYNCSGQLLAMMNDGR